MDGPTRTWWLLLVAVAAFNVAAWAYSARLLRRSRAEPADVRRFRRWQLLLSAGYVAGCAYRSVLPVFDVPRLCLFDSGWSSVIVGRSVATVAELCFAAQWALLLRHAGAARASRLVLPLIGVAELCSWSAVLTTANLGHVVEESLWAAAAALVVAGLLLQRRQVPAGARAPLALVAFGGAVYVAYLVQVDVPMYWARWAADQAHGRAYLDLAQGIADASTRWVVSHRWADWRSEVGWMSAYFSVGVWLSLALVHWPLVHRARAVRAWPVAPAAARSRERAARRTAR